MAKDTLAESFAEQEKLWDRQTRRIRKADREHAATKAFEARLKKELMRWAEEIAPTAKDDRHSNFVGWVMACANLTREERKLLLESLYPAP